MMTCPERDVVPFKAVIAFARLVYVAASAGVALPGLVTATWAKVVDAKIVETRIAKAQSLFIRAAPARARHVKTALQIQFKALPIRDNGNPLDMIHPRLVVC